MSIQIVRAAIGAVALSLSLTPALAQQGGHQMAGMAGGGAAMCAQNSEGVTRAIDVVNGHIEDARQTNDAAKMRAAVSDLQVVLAQMKTQLADCVALAGEAGGGATGHMPGMDHSKLPMPSVAPVMQPGSTASAPGAKPAAPKAGMDHSKMVGTPSAKSRPTEPPTKAGMDHSKMGGDKAAPAGAATPSRAEKPQSVVFTLRTQPAPPRSGKNDFEVTVKDADGKPIVDAEVSLAFYLAPMPSMNMPEMRGAAQLTSAGGGVYKGSGTIGMSGDWDVTITAARKGQTLGTKKVKLTAK